MDQVKDPVCGMMVDSATATEKSEYNGKQYAFCSKDCKREFDENPQEYADKA